MWNLWNTAHVIPCEVHDKRYASIKFLNSRLLVGFTRNKGGNFNKSKILLPYVDESTRVSLSFFLYIFMIFVYFVHFCRPLVASTQYCAIPGGIPP